MTERDIVFLVADGAMEQMLRGFFSRPQFHRSIRCAHFDFDPSEDLIVAPTKDPGVFNTARELLRPFETSHRHAVAMLDNAWEGSPGRDRIHDSIADTLKEAWERFAVIVIEPELEAWVWQENPHIAEAFNCPTDFREILARSNHWPRDLLKPPDPKEALEHLRKRYRADRQNAAFRRLAAKISVRHCQDRAFNHLCDNLRTWFPETYQ
ncbi:methylation-associated defense system protein MAD4 [Actinomadura verrucosospora]|uniref:Concanavalin A-like lectin/glucanase domain protein n=1 Tax=Actinomadura verrucosospora TaxID=46165 RepID=A0A7D3W0Q0_ACTVE|nr:hypothetical protein [Actinomadura verrucosospora]QKG25574.1 concanavalin A-like lectin/glucanase domain protein [Actinomadura verrucosospora]